MCREENDGFAQSPDISRFALAILCPDLSLWSLLGAHAAPSQLLVHTIIGAVQCLQQAPGTVPTKHGKLLRKTSTEGENPSNICYVTFLVNFLTMASQTGCEIMNSEVAGSILTVFPVTRKRRILSHVQEPVKPTH